MLTIPEIEKMNNENRLKLNLIYRLEIMSDGYGLIYAKSYAPYSKDALICCKPIKECKELLNGCIFTELVQ